MFADLSGYSAILFRRTYADLTLPGALIDRAHAWWDGTAARWNDNEKRWRFPSGASISFGYLDGPNDHYRYQGAEFQFIGFDELTQFQEAPVRYLFSRLRKLKGVEIPIRFRASSNPGGIGHEWVKLRYVDPGRADRPFIPARLDDNPYLDREDYELSLSELDGATKRQLMHGDWDARPPGSKFRREWFVVADAEPKHLDVCRYWDLAATAAKPGKDPDWTAGALLGRDRDGVTYVLDVRRIRATPGEVKRFVGITAEEDAQKYGLAVRVRMEQEPGASGVGQIDYYSREVLSAHDFAGVKSTGSKEIRANPFSAQCERGNVMLLRGSWIPDYLDELESFPDGAHDDMVDATSGAYQELAAGASYELAVDAGADRQTGSDW